MASLIRPNNSLFLRLYSFTLIALFFLGASLPTFYYTQQIQYKSINKNLVITELPTYEEGRVEVFEEGNTEEIGFNKWLDLHVISPVVFAHFYFIFFKPLAFFTNINSICNYFYLSLPPPSFFN